MLLLVTVCPDVCFSHVDPLDRTVRCVLFTCVPDVLYMSIYSISCLSGPITLLPVTICQHEICVTDSLTD